MPVRAADCARQEKQEILDAAGRGKYAPAGGIIVQNGLAGMERTVTAKANLQFVTKKMLAIAVKSIIINIGIIKNAKFNAGKEKLNGRRNFRGKAARVPSCNDVRRVFDDICGPEDCIFEKQ